MVKFPDISLLNQVAYSEVLTLDWTRLTKSNDSPRSNKRTKLSNKIKMHMEFTLK